MAVVIPFRTETPRHVDPRLVLYRRIRQLLRRNPRAVVAFQALVDLLSGGDGHAA